MKLTVDEIIKEFGSQKAMHEALEVSKQSVTNMKKRGFIPPAQAIKIHEMEDIKIKIDQIPVKP